MSQMLLRILPVLGTICLLSGAWARHILFKDCGSMAGAVKWVDVTPCPAQPCKFIFMENTSVSIHFVAGSDTSKVSTVVYGIVSGEPIPLPMLDPNACDKGIRCPVQKGDTNTYKEDIYVDPSYPPIRLDIQVLLKDDLLDDMVCLTFPAEIGS